MTCYTAGFLCNGESCYQTWSADDPEHAREQFWDFWNGTEDVVELKSMEIMDDGEAAKEMLQDFLGDRRSND